MPRRFTSSRRRGSGNIRGGIAASLRRGKRTGFRRRRYRVKRAPAFKTYKSAPIGFGKVSLGRNPPQPVQWQQFKLLQMHYGLFGSSGGDEETWSIYGQVKFSRTYSGHYGLWGTNSATAAQLPSDRATTNGTVDMTKNDQYSYGVLQPYYDHFEVFNTSTFGCYFEVPWLVRWSKAIAVQSATTMESQIQDQIGRSGQTLMLTHGAPDTRRNLDWHGVNPSFNEVVSAFGINAMDIGLDRGRNVLRWKRLKSYKWYIPPGGSIHFKIKVPGIKRCIAPYFDDDGAFRYGDYSLYLRMKGDLAAISGVTDSDGRGIVRPKQYIAIRRTSTSVSRLCRVQFGRMGLIADVERTDNAIPAGTQQRPALNTELVEQKNAF